jgi:hypothetical protein
MLSDLEIPGAVRLCAFTGFKPVEINVFEWLEFTVGKFFHDDTFHLRMAFILLLSKQVIVHCTQERNARE